jgi:hypothetical protein
MTERNPIGFVPTHLGSFLVRLLVSGLDAAMPFVGGLDAPVLPMGLAHGHRASRNFVKVRSLQTMLQALLLGRGK